jgi:hypothetical protein
MGKREERENRLIGHPTKPAQCKELPVVRSHADVLNGLVDQFGFAYVRRETM